MEESENLQHQERTEDEAGVEQIKQIKVEVEPSGFKIGGENSTDLIRSLKELNGQAIEDLEERKVGEYSVRIISNLLDILASDNDFVISQGLTHQDLARVLREASVNYESEKRGKIFNYKGNRYLLGLNLMKRNVLSPFKDDTDTSIIFYIANLDNDEKIGLSPALLIEMIERYGFYGGREYRIEPSQIIKVFPHLREEGKKRLLARGIKKDVADLLNPDEEK